MKRHPTTFTVYLATCRATGKVYVGCTSRSLRERREQHHLSAMGGSPHKFHKALREFGLASFVWTVLATVDSRAAMYAAERSHVARYNSFKAGYNSTPGGQGSDPGPASRRKLPIRPAYRGTGRPQLLRR